jgi:serpin B
VAAALRTLYAGAQGKTAAEMEAVVTDYSPRNNSLLSTANALWVQPGFHLKKAYLADCQARGAEVYEEPITTRRVNNWAARNTKNKINEIVSDPLPADMRMLIANAIWFKGDWVLPFEANSTHQRSFTPRQGEPYPVDVMAQTDHFLYTEDKQAQVLTMAYRPADDGTRYAMDIVLPHEGITTSEVLKTLNTKRLQAWRDSATVRKVNVWLPKLTMEYERILNPDLQALGMRRVFNMNQADLHGMSDEDLLYLGTVKQKSFLRMDELGTEAAAVTVAMLLCGAMPFEDPIVNFHVTRPYLLLLREQQTGAILFIGKVEQVMN